MGREAADAWAQSSATSVSSMMSKEFDKISDGVATSLAKELSQSRKPLGSLILALLAKSQVL